MCILGRFSWGHVACRILLGVHSSAKVWGLQVSIAPSLLLWGRFGVVALGSRVLRMATALWSSLMGVHGLYASACCLAKGKWSVAITLQANAMTSHGTTTRRHQARVLSQTRALLCRRVGAEAAARNCDVARSLPTMLRVSSKVNRVTLRINALGENKNHPYSNPKVLEDWQGDSRSRYTPTHGLATRSGGLNMVAINFIAGQIYIPTWIPCLKRY